MLDAGRFVVYSLECIMPSLRASLTNLSAPMPLSKKVRLLVQNNWYKLRHHTNCCGHPGEPGC